MMNFLKNLFKKKSYHKYGDTLKNRQTLKEQRLEAIDVLATAPPDQSIPELLKRFEIVIESGLQDRKEKEYCFDIIVKHPDNAKPYIVNYLKKQKRLAWVIKIAEKIFSSEENLALLLENLKTDIVAFDDDTMERNLDILHALKEFQHPDITEKVSTFLNSRDDDTCLAALECLEKQAHNDTKARHIILNLAQNPPTDMNSRFMGAVTHIVQKHHWLDV